MNQLLRTCTFSICCDFRVRDSKICVFCVFSCRIGCSPSSCREGHTIVDMWLTEKRGMSPDWICMDVVTCVDRHADLIAVIHTWSPSREPSFSMTCASPLRQSEEHFTDREPSDFYWISINCWYCWPRCPWPLDTKPLVTTGVHWLKLMVTADCSHESLAK